MRRAILLDQAIERTGFAVFDYPYFGSELLVASGVYNPDERDLFNRIASYHTLIDYACTAYKPVEMVIEDHRYSGGRNPMTDEDLAVIGFTCRVVAQKHKIPCYRMNPMTIKARGAGDGSADKDLILKVAHERHPEVEIIDHNQADALIMGRAWRSYRSEAVEKSCGRKRRRTGR